MINSNEIKTKFRNLEQRRSSEESYKVISFPNFQHKLGKSDDGHPMFFICVNESTSQVKNIIRELLSVEYNQVCRVESPDGDQENTFAIITLRSLEWTLQASFLDIVLLMLGNMQPLPSRKELAVEVENLITIFSAMQNPPVKKMQGLWGELLIIESSNYPEAIVAAWHNSPNAKYDFTMGTDKIEVKTTSSENRIHKFSLDQLNPSRSSRLLIASMTVRESGPGNGGKSIRDLFDSILSRVTNCTQKIRLFQILSETIGTDFAKIDSVFFDYTEAVDTLDYFRAQDIPHIDKKDVPAGVTEVKFSSNLSDIQSISSLGCTEEYKNSSLFKCIF